MKEEKLEAIEHELHHLLRRREAIRTMLDRVAGSRIYAGSACQMSGLVIASFIHPLLPPLPSEHTFAQLLSSHSHRSWVSFIQAHSSTHGR